MFIIDDIISWVVSKVLDKFFSKKEENNQVAQLLINRISELENQKEKLNNDLQKEKESQKNEKIKIFDALKNRGISTEKLIEKYDKPLMAIIISYASQKEKNKKGSYEDSPFLRSELERYNSKYLGGTDAIIPPTKVPSWIKNEVDLKNWFEKEILKGRFCKIKFMSLIDLKKKTFWNTYLPYEQKKPKHFSIGEVLKIEDVLTEEQINKISLSQIIHDGDIVWLASSCLSGNELELITKNQAII